MEFEWWQFSSGFQDSVFWLISTMLPFGCSPLVLLFPIPPVLISILYWLYHVHHLQLVFIFTFMFQNLFNSLSIFSLYFNYTLWSAGTAKSTILQVLRFLLIFARFGRLAKIRWSVCIQKAYSVSHFTGQMLCCAFTICSYGQISCTSPSGLPCPPSRV